MKFLMVAIIFVSISFSCASDTVSGSYTGKVVRPFSNDTSDGTLLIKANGADEVNLIFTSSLHPTITINNASVKAVTTSSYGVATGTIYEIQVLVNGYVQGYMTPPDYIDLSYQNPIDTVLYEFIGNK